MAEESRITNGLLSTVTIEPFEGKLVACGGIDGKLHIYQLNLDSKKQNDKITKVIAKR
jgi:hypothetical protein